MNDFGLLVCSKYSFSVPRSQDSKTTLNSSELMKTLNLSLTYVNLSSTKTANKPTAQKIPGASSNKRHNMSMMLQMH